MGLNAVKMLGISITSSSKKEILEFLQKYLLQRQKAKGKRQKLKAKPLVIVTPNPEQIVLAQKNTHFAQILNQADVALPDGVGVVWASRFLTLTHRHADTSTLARAIPGVEFMGDLVTLAAKQGYRLALIGGRGGVAVEALECLRRRHPGLVGWAEDGPELQIRPIRPASPELQRGEPISQSDQSMQQFNNVTMQQFEGGPIGKYIKEIVRKIRSTQTRIIFVGLGAPKQELFIQALSRQLSVVSQAESRKLKSDGSVVLMVVGGSFDIITGRIPRAPQFIRNFGLEWLWRLVRQPWRFKRQLALVKFVFLVLRRL